MGNNIRLFQTQAEYIAEYYNRTLDVPNVSYTVDNDTVHYLEEYPNPLSVILSLNGGTTETHIYNDGIIPYREFSSRTDIVSVEICNEITEIGEGAFMLCSGLTSVTIPESVTKIGPGAFINCAITSIDIPDGVTSIKENALLGCTGLTSLVIPSGVTNIEKWAFYNCSNLTAITCNATTAPTLDTDALANMSSTGTLYVPTGSDYSTWITALGSGWTVSYI